MNNAISEAKLEAERLMTVCNSCRYCEGLCAVFPAMELRRTFTSSDLNYLANLCHNCGACYDDCQFTAPHEFNVNVPRVLAQVRNESYADYAWPRVLAAGFRRNGLMLVVASVATFTAFLVGFMATNDPAVMFGVHLGEGAFYRIMPHNVMVVVFGGAFVFALVGLFMAVRAFWRDITADQPGLDMGILPLWAAIRDAATLRYLDGGGAGCAGAEDKPRDLRRLFHHFTFYGFALCFAATCVATVYAYLLDRHAPYPWWDLPVLLGALGGVGLIVGPLGLLIGKYKRDPALTDGSSAGMETVFIAMLLLVSLTGMALLVLRATPLMGTLLALHLGVVLGFFLTMPYGKFVHGFYRLAALVYYSMERARGDLD